MKIGLLGGQNIARYSVADVLWEKISEISEIKLSFEFIPTNNFTELCGFYWRFCEDKEFIGFNIALPWKEKIISLVNSSERQVKDLNSVNVVYRKDNFIYSSNTDVIGLERSLSQSRGDLSTANILIIGAGGAGLPSAIYLAQKYKCPISIYDLRRKEIFDKDCINFINDYSKLADNTYNVIINATPVGKYYLDEFPDQFSMPISINVLDKITTEASILIEMNYFPYETEFLKFANFKKIKAVSGINMLVYQALESMRLYTGYIFNENDSLQIIEFMKNYVLIKENELLR